MKRLKIYLETSVWNFLLVDDSPEKRAITQRFFREIDDGKYDVFISKIVETEIQRAQKQKSDLLFALIEEYKPTILADSVEVEDLVSLYINSGLLTQKHVVDLTHAAIATVNEMDMLVSWNMRHLVRHRTRVLVNAINQIKGYRALEIVTPEEVVEYGIS